MQKAIVFEKAMALNFRAIASYLLIAVVCGTVRALPSLDTYQPILRVSPATERQDRFGFAVTAHQKTSEASDFTHLQALNDVLIVVGAPYGRYPGGLDLPLNRSVCQQTGNYTDEELAGLNDTQIGLCYQRTGLVYQCPMVGDGRCSAMLGNGDENGVDGRLFDRQGNVQEQNRIKDQMMGYTLLSSGDYFIACAPLWKTVMFQQFIPEEFISEILPHGRCVLSGRNLTNFSYVRPCNGGTSASQSNEGYCTAGFGLAISKDGNHSRLAVGAIGLDESRGGVFYYDELNNPITDKLASSQKITPPDTADYKSSFYGFTNAAGNFDGTRNNSNFYVSAPRFNSQTSVGQVYAVENITEFPTLTQQGDQFGEYFGYSMAVADLNGDGYDDVVVGAPFYSEQSAREIGRVIVLYNNKGQGLVRNASIVGKTANGRFGHSLASLGDLNNDGFEDFAVGAPYENGGTVYVYHGKNSSDDNIIVNTSEQQVITAENMVSQLTNLTNLTSFGYTLNGEIDVDNNKYRDLVIGAYESQAVFVLRAVPVADVKMEISNHVQDVDFRNKSCLVNTGPVACFDFSVCGRFTGRGLGSFAANFTLREEVADSNRLFFDPNNSESSVFRDSLSFSGPAVRTCNTYTAYIRNDSSNTLGSLSFTVTIDQFDRSSPPVTIDHVPTTFSNVPVIMANAFTAQVSFLVQCGPDRVCDSDLALTHTSITYINSSIKASEYQNALTVDATTQINITLQYSNLAEDAFDPFLTFTLPTELSSPRIYSKAAHDISCSPTSTIDTSSFLCTGFQHPLSSTDTKSEITLNVQVGSGVDVGTDLVIPFAFMIRNVNRNRENATLLANNHINVTIPVQARAVAQVRIVVQPNPNINYFGNQTGSQITSNFPSRHITFSFTKRQSSSTIHNTSLSIYLPVFAGEQGGSSRYYLYPSAISMRSSEMVCDEAGVINPDNIANLVSNQRQRRHLVTRHQSNNVYADLKRLVRQSSDTVTAKNTVNCSRTQPPAACQRLNCRITDLSSSTASLTITVFVDERYFLGDTDTYSLVAYAEAVIHDNDLNQTGSQLTASVPITLTKEPSVGVIPIYAIVVPIVAAVLLIIVLVIVLYFCGFFRRKSHKRKEEESETEESNANGAANNNENNYIPSDNRVHQRDSNSEEEASSNSTDEDHRQSKTDDRTEENGNMDDEIKDTKQTKYSDNDLSSEEQRSAEYYNTVLSSSTDI